MTKTCSNNAPPGFTGHWRDWHRGHGCDKDDGNTRGPDAAIEASQARAQRVTQARAQEARSFDHSDRTTKQSLGVLGFCVCAHCVKLPIHASSDDGEETRLRDDGPSSPAPSSEGLLLSERLQRHLVRDLLRRHPLPWRTEVDWTLEVYDARGRLVTKLMNVDEFTELHDFARRLAREDGLNREESPCVGDAHVWDPDAKDLSPELWDIVDPVCTACGWRSSEIEARRGASS